MPKTLLIIYFSNTGKTEKMAMHAAGGAKNAGANVVLKRVEDCTTDDLEEADGIAVGSPTHYSNISWQIKRLLDETILSYCSNGHSLRDKVCGCFTSTGAYSDGIECLRMLELAFGFTLKMRIVPGTILESKDVDDGNLSSCYEFGRKLARELE